VSAFDEDNAPGIENINLWRHNKRTVPLVIGLHPLVGLAAVDIQCIGDRMDDLLARGLCKNIIMTIFPASDEALGFNYNIPNCSIRLVLSNLFAAAPETNSAEEPGRKLDVFQLALIQLKLDCKATCITHDHIIEPFPELCVPQSVCRLETVRLDRQCFH